MGNFKSKIKEPERTMKVKTDVSRQKKNEYSSIQYVIQETNCSETVAKNSLRETNGNMILSIKLIRETNHLTRDRNSLKKVGPVHNNERNSF
jgi:hypothetical protein